MEKTLGEIAEFLQGKLIGDRNIKIYGVAGITEAQPGQLTFLANSRYRNLLPATKASAAIVGEGEKFYARTIPAGDRKDLALIRHPNPYLAFVQVLKLFTGEPKAYSPGVHPTVLLDRTVKLGENVHIGPYVIIEAEAEVQKNSTILAGSYIGSKVKVGENCFIFPKVIILRDSLIGDRVIIQSGTVIGSDGFGYAQDKGKHYKIPQVGNVIIEDEVEIGANVTIDRATLGSTRIGAGSKLDNLVHIGHNVEIGKNCLVVAQVGISGSTKVGDNVTLAGQAGLVGHIQIGQGAVVGAQAGVTKSVPPHTMVSGYPAREHRKAKKIEAHLSYLSDYVERIKKLEKEVKLLSKKMEKRRVKQ